MKNLNTFIQSLQGKTIAIIGMGVSNSPLINLLLEHRIPFTIRDIKPDPSQNQLQEQGANFIIGDGYLDNLSEDIVFRTPGLSPNTPQLQKAKANGQEITSEMQAFFNLCPCPIIAVTGSDGKTTTTTLISKFLEATGKKVFVGGNIGKPLLCDVDTMTQQDMVVLELSSFQLMDIDCAPDVAVVTNLSPNHLDYHKDMAEYVQAKTNIFTKQSQEQTVIFNLDNETSMELVPMARGIVKFFSRLTDKGHIQVKNNGIYLGDTLSIHLEQIQLKGVHNIENYMTAILAVEDYCTPEQLQQVAISFTGVEHRMQRIRCLNQINYYNDSIGTSPTRTIAGLRSFQEPIILIAGGYDKGIPFDELGTEIHRHVKHLLLVGATAHAIETAVEQARPQEGTQLLSTNHYPDLKSALDAVQTMAKPKDNVVLSPACAAFDQYKNFAQRGKHFEELVNQL